VGDNVTRKLWEQFLVRNTRSAFKSAM